MRNYNYPESYTNIKEAFHDVIRHTKNLDVKDLFSFYLNQLEDYSQLKEPPNSFKIAKTVKSLYLKELFKFLFKVIKKRFSALRWWGFKVQMFNPQLNLNRITND